MSNAYARNLCLTSNDNVESSRPGKLRVIWKPPDNVKDSEGLALVNLRQLHKVKASCARPCANINDFGYMSDVYPRDDPLASHAA